jgi:hypothetical protein
MTRNGVRIFASWLFTFGFLYSVGTMAYVALGRLSPRVPSDVARVSVLAAVAVLFVATFWMLFRLRFVRPLSPTIAVGGFVIFWTLMEMPGLAYSGYDPITALSQSVFWLPALGCILGLAGISRFLESVVPVETRELPPCRLIDFDRHRWYAYPFCGMVLFAGWRLLDRLFFLPLVRLPWPDVLTVVIGNAVMPTLYGLVLLRPLRGESVRRVWAHLRTQYPHECPWCGYDIHACTTPVCPECGQLVDSDS